MLPGYMGSADGFGRVALARVPRRRFRDATTEANAAAAEAELDAMGSGMPWSNNPSTVAGGPSPTGTQTPTIAQQNTSQPPGAALSNSQGPSGFTNTASNAQMSSNAYSSSDSDSDNSSWYQGLVQAAPGIISAAGSAIQAATASSGQPSTVVNSSTTIVDQPTTVLGIPLTYLALAAAAYFLLKD